MSLVMERGILAIREISISSRFKTSPDNCRGNLFYPWIRTAWGSWQSSLFCRWWQPSDSVKNRVTEAFQELLLHTKLRVQRNCHLHLCTTASRSTDVKVFRQPSLTWRSIMQTKWKTKAPTMRQKKSLSLRQIRTKGSKKDFHTSIVIYFILFKHLGPIFQTQSILDEV